MIKSGRRRLYINTMSSEHVLIVEIYSGNFCC